MSQSQDTISRKMFTGYIILTLSAIGRSEPIHAKMQTDNKYALTYRPNGHCVAITFQ